MTRHAPPWACLALLLALCPAAPGQGPAPLRWGGDKAGGAPYIYETGDRFAGFEAELAEHLAAEIGRRPEFVQGDWDVLPDALKRGDIDVVLNGYEYLPSREGEFASTLPYYVYTLRLIARAGDESIRSWEDLRAAEGRAGKRVGVLRGSLAERYLRQRFGETITLVPTREVDETFQLVEGGERLDATVQDSPAAEFFVQGGRRPGLRVVGEPVAPGFYVILTRPEDEGLRERLNEAIREAYRSGKLEEIYSRYGLWNEQQRRLAEAHAGPWPPPEGSELVGDLPDTRLTVGGLWPKILRAAGMTIALAFCSFPLAILIGIGVAVGRVYGPMAVRAPLTFYVELIRGTPLLLQLFVLFFMFPQLAKWTGWGPLVYLATLPPFVVGVAGLAINYSAYEAEIYRAGLLAIPRGQMEAALALGMKPWTAVRRVILPQAVRLVVPPVTNDFIALFKDTSICSVILITELTGLYYQYKYDRGVALELALVVGALYLLMSYPLARLARRLEHRQPRAIG
ncbi:MAG TPA: ABC transporter substrate-binding protein/permease [Gemmataceae bacterium]